MTFNIKNILGKDRYQPEKKLKIVMYCLEIVQLLTAIVFFVYFYKMNMWPVKYLLYVSVITIVAFIAAFVLKNWKRGCIVSIILSIIMIIVQCIGCYYIYITNKTLDKITENTNTTTSVVSVFVLKENKAEVIQDAKNYTFGILTDIDRENSDLTVEKINEEVNKSIKTVEHDNYLNLAASLYSGKVEAIILNDAYVDLIGDFEGYEKFETDIKKIYTYEIVEDNFLEEETTTVQEKKVFDITKDTFNVYISGIDTTGVVTTKSRSDVNIIMSVNPKKRQILMVSTPRDYFVPLSISNGVKDKLTHAGLYGVDVSMKTLEDLYGIDMNYFVRMNFTGFTDIINTLGGIEVYSEYSFSAKGHSFQAGYNQLNGEAALIFARERHSFASGDNQRGKNQMEVIKAVIDKAQNSSLLDDYASILDSISESMQTNMSRDEISKLVKMQLKTGTPWNVVSYSVTGSGQSQYTYTVPNSRAYVMIPNTDSVEEAKKLFAQVKAGKKLKDNEKETD